MVYERDSRPKHLRPGMWLRAPPDSGRLSNQVLKYLGLKLGSAQFRLFGTNEVVSIGESWPYAGWVLEASFDDTCVEDRELYVHEERD